MSQKVSLTIPDLHYDWLMDVMKRRGWDNVQDAIRSVIEDGYRLDSKLGRKTNDPVLLKAAEADSPTQTS